MSIKSSIMANAYLYDLTRILLDIISIKEMTQFGGVTCRSDVISAKRRQHKS